MSKHKRPSKSRRMAEGGRKHTRQHHYRKPQNPPRPPVGLPPGIAYLKAIGAAPDYIDPD